MFSATKTQKVPNDNTVLIFTYNGKKAHELILFYNVDIDDKDYKEKYHIIDDNAETDAVWVDIDKFINKELKIYPEQMYDYLNQ